MSSLSLLPFFLALTLHASILSVFAEENNTTSSKCPSTPFTPRIVANKEEAQLKVLVPNISLVSLRQFVDCSDPSHVRGFCIDVFETALSILVPAYLSSTTIHYTCFNFSPLSPNTTDTPTYDDMIGGVANGSYDAVVGDVTIGAQREFEVEFTHQYMESRVVILAKVVNDDVWYEWRLFQFPFTWRMWCMVMGSFAFTGFILWIIEHKNHLEFTQGSFAKRIYKICWFIMEALILLERESIKSKTAQLVMVAWVFMVLLFSASYTAGLSSILTFDIAEPKLTSEGFGFGFRRGLEWADKFSIALMNLTESGCLVELQDNHKMTGDTKTCSSSSQSQKVSWRSSLSLSLPLILISYLCVIISYIRQFQQERPRVTLDPSILLTHIETAHRHRHLDVELSTLPQP